MGQLLGDLKNKVVKRKYQFNTNVFGGCIYLRGFNFINLNNGKTSACNDEYYEKIENQISQYENSILIFGGYFPLYLLEKVDSFIPVGKYNTLEDSIRDEILKFSKKNKIILIYPTPEIGQNPNQVILNKWVKQGFSNNFDMQNFTISFDIFKNRTKSSFELLDSIQGNNIYRVYPHTLFCNTRIKNKCVTHDNKNIFYFDDHHLSPKGIEMLNNLIMKEIEKIEIEFN